MASKPPSVKELEEKTTALSTPNGPSRNGEVPVVAPGLTDASITAKISNMVLTRRTPMFWFIGFLVGFLGFNMMMLSLTWLIIEGPGVWGNNVPVGWAFDIINFVWWIGIGHAGTLISAILLLFYQTWRTSINRLAEAMTLFAVMAAGLFPLLHTGRPWFDYWMFPYPSNFGVWPQFRSPLIWDVFAITTYATVSALFWYVGLIPDLATLRDRAKNKVAQFSYGILALGWNGSTRHWHRFERSYFLLAALSTPLVVSVHTVVSYDFATSVIPGWHATIFPPYFVLGAIYAGFAMVLTIVLPLRKLYGLEDFITARHLNNMGKVMLVAGLVVAYGYFMEHFTAWYSGNQYEMDQFFRIRPFGPYAFIFWAMVVCNVVVPQALWSHRVRNSTILLWIVAMFINFGMWFERFNIIVQSLARDFIPAAWHNYTPTIWDFGLFFGTIGMFIMFIFLFFRVLPSISAFEMRDMVHQMSGGHGASAEDTHQPGAIAPATGSAD